MTKTIASSSIKFLSALFAVNSDTFQRSNAFQQTVSPPWSILGESRATAPSASASRYNKLFSYLDSLSSNDAAGDKGKEEATIEYFAEDSNSYLASWAGNTGGQEYQDQYGRTIKPSDDTESPPSSPSLLTSHDPVEEQQAECAQQKNFSLQYDPMAAVTRDEVLEDNPFSQIQQTEKSSSPRRKSSIQSLQDVTVTNNPYYTVGKDELQQGRQRLQNENNNRVTQYRRSPNFDFAKESDKYLIFSSQRIGHDRLEPVDRSKSLSQNSSSGQVRPSESVLRETRPNTMFQSNNQATVLNARALAEKPNIDMDHLNDVISSPSPFRFLGQPNPNFELQSRPLPRRPDADGGVTSTNSQTEEDRYPQKL
ncbi:hypothetical protein IV203_035970 [Nitzschia inconspicua]|uniref:Uncharacterized protein n=1 Tax=Nitzschia inconspicua TaxID=303405 RepID=A0A9K3LH81_9STRA|nr:hypothetical protein IV203_035970 [Nitzschia inconspicua]